MQELESNIQYANKIQNLEVDQTRNSEENFNMQLLFSANFQVSKRILKTVLNLNFILLLNVVLISEIFDLK
jgi:hypothetical protein